MPAGRWRIDVDAVMARLGLKLRGALAFGGGHGSGGGHDRLRLESNADGHGPGRPLRDTTRIPGEALTPRDSLPDTPDSITDST